jgi:hypothetical protein
VQCSALHCSALQCCVLVGDVGEEVRQRENHVLGVTLLPGEGGKALKRLLPELPVDAAPELGGLGLRQPGAGQELAHLKGGSVPAGR